MVNPGGPEAVLPARYCRLPCAERVTRNQAAVSLRTPSCNLFVAAAAAADLRVQQDAVAAGGRDLLQRVAARWGSAGVAGGPPGPGLRIC